MQYLAMSFILSILVISDKLFTIGGAFAAVAFTLVFLPKKHAEQVCALIAVMEIVHAIA